MVGRPRQIRRPLPLGAPGAGWEVVGAIHLPRLRRVMFNPLCSIKLLPALAATLAIGAFGAFGVPAASADTAPTAWLYPNGQLSFTGTSTNDSEKVTRVGKAGVPGGYVIRVESGSWSPPNFSANCTEAGGDGHWAIECSGPSVTSLAFDGGLSNDSFNNTTNLPSEAHGGPGIEFLYGGTGTDVLYGDADQDHIWGGGGDDVVEGGADTDTISG